MLWFNVQISSICWNWFNFFETDFIFLIWFETGLDYKHLFYKIQTVYNE